MFDLTHYEAERLQAAGQDAVVRQFLIKPRHGNPLDLFRVKLEES